MLPNGVGKDGSNNGTAAVLGFGSHGLRFGMAGSDFVEIQSRPRMWMASGYVPSWAFASSGRLSKVNDERRYLGSI